MTMEEIFANHGYNTIVLIILNYLDTESMVNLTKVSKTVCFNMKSIKTCQIYFNKCMPILPPSTKLRIPKKCQIRMKTKSQNDFRADELIELFNYLKQLGDFTDRKQFQRVLQGGFEFTPFPEINPQHFEYFSQNIQPKIQPIWELFDSFYKFSSFHYLHYLHQPAERTARFEDVISKLVAAFNCLQRCPLILAMEMNQEDLARFLLDCNMLNICNCAKLLSMVQHSVVMYHSEILVYFHLERENLPREFNLDVACNGRLQEFTNSSCITHFQDILKNNYWTVVQNYALPFNQQEPMPFPNFANNAINNQIQVPAAMPNSPAGAVNNQARQAAGPNPGAANAQNSANDS